jgi:hypothetical protein
LEGRGIRLCPHALGQRGEEIYYVEAERGGRQPDRAIARRRALEGGWIMPNAVQAGGVAMNNEDVYQATKKVFAAYAGFFHEVVKEIGLERALALHQAAQERIGLTTARVLWSPGREKLELGCLQKTLLASNRSIGIDSELAETTATSAVLRNARCPMFDGYWMGGLDDRTARLLCERGTAARLAATLHELNPRVAHQVTHYRSNPEDACLEEIALQ